MAFSEEELAKHATNYVAGYVSPPGASNYWKPLTTVVNQTGDRQGTICSCCGSRTELTEDILYHYGIHPSVKKPKNMQTASAQRGSVLVHIEVEDVSEIVGQPLFFSLLIQDSFNEQSGNIDRAVH
ncbi:MAG TPA: hypothetical protein VFM18_01565 [Methanosarcina sp.]|nr:hypothetical protein [Methanosarcina sp.]